jgi:hypothetical protein
MAGAQRATLLRHRCCPIRGGVLTLVLHRKQASTPFTGTPHDHDCLHPDPRHYPELCSAGSLAANHPGQPRSAPTISRTTLLSRTASPDPSTQQSRLPGRSSRVNDGPPRNSSIEYEIPARPPVLSPLLCAALLRLIANTRMAEIDRQPNNANSSRPLAS